MARLPVPGSDSGGWGDLLNEFLGVTHNGDGTLKASATSASGAEMTVHKGQPNGYASLDGNGLVPTAQLPVSATAVAAYMGVEVNGVDVLSGDFTQVAFTNITAQLDPSSISWDAGSPENITILQTGVYSFTAGVYWRDPGLTGPILVQIISSCQFNFADIRPAIGDGVTESQQFLTVSLYLQAGQSVHVNIQQSTGSTLAPFIQVLVTRCA